jgi:hypothetical protein
MTGVVCASSAGSKNQEKRAEGFRPKMQDF